MEEQPFLDAIFNFIAGATIFDICLIIASLLIFLLFFIHCYASLSNETFLENFDNHTPGYMFFACITIIPLLLLLFFKIIPEFFFITIFLTFILTAISQKRRSYYSDENNQNPVTRNLIKWYFLKRQRRINRRISLQAAKDFLRPYKNIFGKQTLSNKFCNVTYQPDKKLPKFICIDINKNKNGKYEFFEVLNPAKPEIFDNFFNSLCVNFNYNMNFYTLHKIFKTSDFQIHYINCTEKDFKEIHEINIQNTYPYNVLDKIKNKEKEIIENANSDKLKENKPMIKDISKININEASEAEITSLPGINIIQAKKIIKYRTLNGDFKSVDDFLNYIKLKPHFEEQLKNLITTTSHILKLDFDKSNNERIIDLD